MSGKNFLFLHLLSFSLSCIIATLLLYNISVEKLLFPEQQRKTTIHIPNTTTHYFPDYIKGYETELDLRYALENGIVVIGSSEMTNTTLEAIPYNFFNNYYSFFILLLITPKWFGSLLFKIKAYKYARFLPRTFLMIIKEYLLPIFSKKLKYSPEIVKYGKYYLRNFESFLLGRYR